MTSRTKSNEDQYDEMEERKDLLETGIRDFNREIESNFDEIENLSGDLFDLTSGNKTVSSDYDALQADFEAQGRAINDLKAQKRPPIGQIKELEKQRRAIGRRKNLLNKKINANSAEMDFLVTRIMQFLQQSHQLKVQIADSEAEISRIKKALPDLEVGCMLDELCEEFFDCTYEEFLANFDLYYESLKQALNQVLDKTEPAISFVLTTLYGKYTNLRADLHNDALANAKMDAEMTAQYYRALLDSGIEDATARQLMKEKIESQNMAGFLSGDQIKELIPLLIKTFRQF